ncbi:MULTISPECIES: hypothetical protein [Sorangium]|uniref:hypothetical protein n=1 Tax=Sorangium TaxID=39643 RepID=UPI003D9C1506
MNALPPTSTVFLATLAVPGTGCRFASSTPAGSHRTSTRVLASDGLVLNVGGAAQGSSRVLLGAALLLGVILVITRLGCTGTIAPAAHVERNFRACCTPAGDGEKKGGSNEVSPPDLVCAWVVFASAFNAQGGS